MKLQKVKGLCAKRKTAYIFNKTNELGELEGQYISSGNAIYEITDERTLRTSSLCAMWDILGVQREKWSIAINDLPESINCDWGLGETGAAKEFGTTIEVGGVDYIPFKISRGLVFINAEYLKPIADEIEKIVFGERVMADGTPYIVAMNGLMFVAAFMPERGEIEKLIKDKISNLAAEIKPGTSGEGVCSNGR